MSDERALPVTVLGGYLGAGKTTLVNHLLANSGGRRLGVLVNDIGAVSIDASLVESATGDVVTLANGCICCTLTDGFDAALDQLRSVPIDGILIEASGVADPAAVAAHTQTPGLGYNGTVVVVDASTIVARITDRYVGTTVARQLAAADLVVVNKLDLAPDRAPVEALLRRHAPNAPHIATSFGVVPVEIIVGLEPGAAPTAPFDPVDHPVETRTWDWPIERTALDELLGSLGPEVVRAKGVFDLVEQPEYQAIVQLVGSRREVTTGRPWPPDGVRRSALVVIRRPRLRDDE